MNDERRCLVIDGHPTVRLGIGRLLADRYEVEGAPDGRAAIELITSLGDFDVAIVELVANPAGRSLTGLRAVKALHKRKPGLGIVAHGLQPSREAADEALDAGAVAFVAKSSPAERLVDAVDAAAELERFIDPAAKGKRNGRMDLTRRQREILQHYAHGRSTAEVAKRLGVSTETVRTHTKAVLARLNAHDRAHAVAIALRSAMIE